jgi:hypothetical protein
MGLHIVLGCPSGAHGLHIVLPQVSPQPHTRSTILAGVLFLLGAALALNTLAHPFLSARCQ